MSSTLASFQDAFSRALLTPGAEPAGPLASLMGQPGFAVYRNTVMKGCIDALSANYPSVVRLVGDEWFGAAATEYILAHPPRDTRLLELGADFAGFLEGFGPAAELPYLPGVARLDRFWTESHSAPDEPTASPSALAGLAPERLAGTVLCPHAAARWAWFDEMPIHSIWCRNRQPQEPSGELAWQGEASLLTRPAGAVQWTALDRAGCAFLDACAEGLCLGEAAGAALELDSQADLALLLSRLLAAGAFGAPQPPHDDPTR